MTETQTVTVNLPAPPARHYHIVIGKDILAQTGALLADRLGHQRCVIVTEENVAPLYLDAVIGSLKAAGHTVLPPIIVPAGEGSKSFAQLESLQDRLAEGGADRKTLLIALGGGVIGDLTGFAASIFMRGIDFIQIPTTLLAQTDSSVGGKTGINTKIGKNLVGAFHQPRLVIADTEVLSTLPRRQLLSGYAEIVKYGLIMDRPFFEWCKDHAHALIDGQTSQRIYAVQQSCAFKSRLVEADEHEAGKRALLNLGHTFGHALETVTGYSETLYHGEAVAIGTLMAFRLSVVLGHCTKQDADEVEAHFKAIGLPTAIPPLPAGTNVDQLMRCMATDKKSEEGEITLILAKGIGDCFVAKRAATAPIRQLWEEMIPLGSIP